MKANITQNMRTVCRDCGFVSNSRKERSTHCCCRVTDNEIPAELLEPRIDPWGRTWYLDIFGDDGGPDWTGVDGNGCCFSVPKETHPIENSTYSHCRSHFKS